MARSYQYYGEWEQYHGRRVVVDGLPCVLNVSVYIQKYPYIDKVISVYACPTKQSRQTVQYKLTRQHLGDDWSTDVLESDVELQADILSQLRRKVCH